MVMIKSQSQSLFCLHLFHFIYEMFIPFTNAAKQERAESKPDSLTTCL